MVAADRSGECVSGDSTTQNDYENDRVTGISTVTHGNGSGYAGNWGGEPGEAGITSIANVTGSTSGVSVASRAGVASSIGVATGAGVAGNSSSDSGDVASASAACSRGHSLVMGEGQRRGLFEPAPRYTSGFALGIIAVDLDYPKVPGNVANASTFDFPVLYERVSFEIEQLFAGDSSIRAQVIEAARKLEREGVRAIIGACGYFAYFQRDVAASVGVPVFMSSLCQLPIIKTWLAPGKQVAVFAADGASITDELLTNVSTDVSQLVVVNVGEMASFAPIRWGRGALDNGRLEDDLAVFAQRTCGEHPEVAAILLECSDLPPYAAAIQRATGLPVFDFITLAKWVKSAVVQQPYYGIV